MPVVPVVEGGALPVHMSYVHVYHGVRTRYLVARVGIARPDTYVYDVRTVPTGTCVGYGTTGGNNNKKRYCAPWDFHHDILSFNRNFEPTRENTLRP